LLESHQSTKERFSIYPEFYSAVWRIIGNPDTIVDLGCGMNPCSYSLLGMNPRYEAYELSTADCEFLNTYFKLTGINGYAQQADLLDCKTIFVGDVCLALKLFDSLEYLRRGSTKNLLARIKTSWIVSSFPTVSLGGKKSIFAKRTWFERLLTESARGFITLDFRGERVYVIANSAEAGNSLKKNATQNKLTPSR
jgi:16S rRNA (guanine(1405)-N(7))-methyltransferase